MAAQAKASHLSSSEASSFLISKRAHSQSAGEDREVKRGFTFLSTSHARYNYERQTMSFINYCYFPYILKSVILIFSVFILVVEEVE